MRPQAGVGRLKRLPHRRWWRRRFRLRLEDHARRWSVPLLQLAAGVDGPDFFDGVTAQAVDFFVEIDGNADVVGDDADAVADFEFGAGDGGEVDKAVLFVHLVEARGGGFDDMPEGDIGGVDEAVRGKRFGAAIDDHVARPGGGNDGGEDAGGAIFHRATAAGDGVEIVEDVGAGANFGEAVKFVGVEEGGRGAAAYDLERDAGCVEIGEDAGEERGDGVDGAQAGFIDVLDVAGVEGDAGETQVGQGFDGLCESEERLAGGDADALEADIDFGEHGDFHVRGAGGGGELARGKAAIESDDHVGAARDFGETGEFSGADDGVGDQQIGGFGGGPEFRVGKFWKRERT